MQPDRSNYEIWIADWLAGTLDNEKKKLLEDFLDANPELKEEAESLLFTIITPETRHFPKKDLLKKSAGDLNTIQVEYLSVAYLEDDLSPGQLGDLNNCIQNNPELKELSESVRRIKLAAPDIKYRYKNRLRKRTMTDRIIRFSYMGLGVAASITILILSSVFLSRQKHRNDGISELQNGISEVQTTIQTDTVIFYSQVLQEREFNPVKAQTEKQISVYAYRSDNNTETKDQHGLPEIADNQNLNSDRMIVAEMADIKISVFPDFSFNMIPVSVPYTLSASSIPYREPVYDDRNGLTRFLARTFREKILRDDTGSDAPVRPYEIASAGINGISRLFGLEMTLVSTTDSIGELKSVYFSSRLVRFNAPVKKYESAE